MAEKIVPLPKSHGEWAAKSFDHRFSDEGVTSLDLTVRTWNVVYDMVGPNGTLDDICDITPARWLRCANFGYKSLADLKKALAERGRYLPGTAPREVAEQIERGQTPCRWCGNVHNMLCPEVKAFEYHPDGSLKRVEFKTAADYPQISWGTNPNPVYGG